MTERYTKVLLGVIAIASTLLLTSCSNPDTSGGVTLSKGGDDGNEFPHGSCEGPHKNPPDGGSGCGWISANDKSYYIMPHANYPSANFTNANLTGANLSRSILRGANLTNANLTNAILNNNILRYANLNGANLTNAILSDAVMKSVQADSSTICPNGVNWGSAGSDCGFSGANLPYSIRNVLYAPRVPQKDLFPHGSCDGPDIQGPTNQDTGCGWLSDVKKNSYYLMPRADLRGSYMGSKNLYRANLSGANLSGSNWVYANLRGANLSGADMSGAALSGARFATDQGADGADLSNSNISGANLINAWTFESAILTGVIGNSSTICPEGNKWGTAWNESNGCYN